MTESILKDLIETVEHQVSLFPMGSAQHTLQVNRLNALKVVQQISKNQPVSPEALRSARAPLASLISKSEKALTKLKPDTWQAQRLIRNLETLKPLYALVEQRLNTLDQ